MLDEGYGVRKIGRTLDIPHPTVSREIKRNSYGYDRRTNSSKYGTYEPSSAQQKAYTRRKYAKYQGKKIQEHDELRSFIVEKLKEHYNPDEISGLMKENTSLGFYTSKTTIYEWLYSAWGQQYCEYLYSKRYRPKKRVKDKTKRVMIPGRTPLHERPSDVLLRFESGHCEFDSVVSSKRSKSKYALAVLVERSSRLVRARLVPNLKPKGYAKAIVELTRGLNVASMTTDNGIENKHHQKITKATGARVYFTDPYSSWQKGSVENANKMLRRYFPKGTDFATVSQADVDKALARINNKPRKILGYKSSLLVAKEEGLFAASGALRG